MKRFSSFAPKKCPLMLLALIVGGFVTFGTPAFLLASGTQEAESLVKTNCSTCHKFQGEGESRFNLRAPDLMWGGQ